MTRSVEAIIEMGGEVRLCEKVRLAGPRRAIVTILDDPEVSDTALLAERALAADWLRPEEDEAWSHLQSER